VLTFKIRCNCNSIKIFTILESSFNSNLYTHSKNTKNQFKFNLASLVGEPRGVCVIWLELKITQVAKGKRKSKAKNMKRVEFKGFAKYPA